MSSPFKHRLARMTAARMACVAAVALLSCSASIHAQDLWGGSLTLTNDYRVRGISQTQGDAAIQGGLHLQPATGWTLGTWASSVSRDRGHRTALEVDVYGGYGLTIAEDWDAKATYTHYWYPNDPARSRYDYDEIAASLTFRSQLVATIAWSPNSKYFSRYQGAWHTEDGASASYELTGLQPITGALSVTAGVGYNDLRRVVDDGYWYWNAGLSYAMGPLQFDVSRIDTDATAEQLFGSTVTEAGWSAAVSWRF